MDASDRVLLVGATGLVGRACRDRLLAAPGVASVTVLQRQRGESRPGLHVVVTDFSDLGALADEVFAVDAVICALGTTIARAGSRDAFRRVDHDYPLAVAKRARAAGCTRFGLVSALGADPASTVFYNRVKGETERDLGALGFASLVLARPSLLLGARDEFRLGERLAAPFARCLPRRWRAIPATRVASALVEAVLARSEGTQVLENADLLARAAG
jgi:uncharacterized protein YbjT (DUF2867 family)